MNIFIGNLSREATDEDLRKLFEAFGEVTSANVIKEKFGGQPRGFGFVEMPAKEAAQTAITELNGKEFMGRALNVNEARPRSDDRGGRGLRRRWRRRRRAALGAADDHGGAAGGAAPGAQAHRQPVPALRPDCEPLLEGDFGYGVWGGEFQE